MSAKPKFILIISALALSCLMLFIVLICQFININNAKNHLNNLIAYSNSMDVEVNEMKETLEVIRSEKYKEDEARKKGYGYSNEQRFVTE